MPRPSSSRPGAATLLFAAMTLAACADQPFTVDVPLRVVATDPSDAGAGIVREAVFRTTFSEALTPETALDPDNFAVRRLGVAEFEPERAVDGSLSHSEDGLTVTFTPSARLDYSSRYQLVVGRGARRLRDGAELPAEVRAVFRVIDPPPLRVIAVTPSGANEGVLRTAPLVIRFSEGVRRVQLDPDGDGRLTAAEDGHVAVVDAETGDAIEGTWNYDADDADPENVDLIGPDTVATFTPTGQAFERWGYSQSVELRVKATLESDRATSRGGQVGEDLTFSFRAVDPPGLAVMAFAPGDGLDGVARTSPVVIRFSEGVRQAQLDTDGDGLYSATDREGGSLLTIVDTESGEPVDGELAFDALDDLDPADPEIVGADTTVTFTPTSQDFERWRYSQQVTVTLDAALETDRATTRGGQLGEGFAFTFRALDPPTLGVLSHAPAHAMSGVPRTAAVVLTFTEGVRQGQIDTDGDGRFTAADREAGSVLTVLDTFGFEPIDGTLTFSESEDVDPLDAELIGADTTLTFTPSEQAFERWMYSQELQVSLDTTLETDRATTRGGQLRDDFLLTFRAVDPPAIAVMGFEPGDAMVGVPRTSPVVVRFSEGIAQRQLDTDGDGLFTAADREAGSVLSVVDSETGSAIDGSLSFEVVEEVDPADAEITGRDTRVAFRPTAQAFERWGYSQAVTVTFGAALETDRATDRGGQLGADLTFTFRAADPPALRLLGASPSDAGVGVARTAPVILRLSEGARQADLDPDGDGRWTAADVAAGSTLSVTDAVTGAPIEGTLVFADPADLDAADPEVVGADATVTFSPSSQPFGRWRYAQRVVVELAASLESDRATTRAGQLDGGARVAFEAERPPALALVSALPSDGAEGILRNTPIELVFSEGVRQSQLDADGDGRLDADAAVVVRDADAGTAIPCRVAFLATADLDPADALVTGDDLRVTLTPTGLLGWSQRVRVAIDKRLASDRATAVDGLLPAEVISTFRAIDPPALGLVTSTPGHGATGVLRNSPIPLVFSEGVRRQTLDADGDGRLSAGDGVSVTDTTAGTILAGTLTFDAEDAQPAAGEPGLDARVTLRLDAPVPWSHAVSVSLGATVSSDRATPRGGQLPATRIDFRVEDLPPLRILATNFAGSQSWPSASPLQLALSMAVTLAAADPGTDSPDTVDDDRVWLTRLGETERLPVAFSLGADSKVLELSASDPDALDPAQLNYRTSYALHIASGRDGLCATLSTVTSVDGCLTEDAATPGEVVYAFTTASAPPLTVVASTPESGAIAVPNASAFSVRLSNRLFGDDARAVTSDDVFPADGFADPQKDGLTPNIFVTPGRLNGDRADALALTPDAGCGEPICYDDATNTVRFQPAAPLAPLGFYTIVVTDDLQDTAGGRLLSPALISFQASSGTILIGTSPPTIDVDDGIYAQFGDDLDLTRFDTASAWVTATDPLGFEVLIPGTLRLSHVGVGETDCDGVGLDTGCDRLTFVPAMHVSGCFETLRPLRYATTYRLHLSPRLTSLGHTGAPRTLGAQPPIVVATGLPPVISGISSFGALPTETADDYADLRNAGDVPVNSTISIRFSRDMATSGAGRLTNPAHFRIINTQGTTSTADDVALSGVTLTAPDARTVLLTPPTDFYPYGASLRLSIAETLTDADARTLESAVTADFVTSAPWGVDVSPPEGVPMNVTSTVSVAFTRNVWLPSVSTSNVIVRNTTAGATLASVLALNAATPYTAVVVPVPTFPEGNAVSVTIGRGVLDARGNPLPTPYERRYPSVGGAPATNARAPDSGATLSPAAGVAITGQQFFTFTAATSSTNNRNRLIPATFFTSTTAPDTASILLQRLSGAGGVPVETVPLRFDVDLGADNATPDAVRFQPSSTLAAAGHYRLTLRMALIANLYTIPYTIGNVVRDFQVETTPPTVTSVAVTTDAGASANLVLDGAATSGISAATRVTVTFSEPVRASLASSGLVLRDNGGQAIPRCVTVNGAVVTLTPADPTTCNAPSPRTTPLSAAAGTLTLNIAETIADLAGTPLGSARTARFAVETTRPTLVTMSPSGADVALDAALTARFSEPVDVATACATGASAAFSLTRAVPTACGDTQAVPLCCAVSVDTPSEVTLRPARTWGALGGDTARLAGSVAHTLVATTQLRDRGGNRLLADVTRAFTTASGAPVVLCATPVDSATVLHSGLEVAFYLNQAAELASFADAFDLWREADGATVGCAATRADDGGKTLVCVPEALEVDTEYGYSLGAELVDAAGLALENTVFGTFLTTLLQVQ